MKGSRPICPGCESCRRLQLFSEIGVYTLVSHFTEVPRKQTGMDQTEGKSIKLMRLIGVAVVVVLFCGLAASIYLRLREPRYEGRTLTEWVYSDRSAFFQEPYPYAFHPETDPVWEAAGHAVKQMAPDAIPLLLKWVQAEDSPLKSKVNDWLYKIPYIHAKIKDEDDYHFLACRGFWLLGSEAKPAWPILIRWTDPTDPDRARRHWALRCLVQSRPDKETLLPVLLRLIHDPDQSLKENASRTLHYLYPRDAEPAGVYKMFPDLLSERTELTAANPN